MAIHDDPLFGFKLIVHLLRCPPVISKAVSKLEPEDFNRAGEQSKSILWAISREWYNKYRTPIPKDVLEIDVRNRLQNAPGTLSRDEQASMWTDITAAYMAEDSDMQPLWILEHLSTFLQYRRVTPQLQLAASMNAGPELDSLLDGVFKLKAQSQLSTVQEEGIFTSSTKTTVNVVRDPTGVCYVDHILNGGTLAGELYGVLAPSGGGKTTTGIAIAVERARRQLHTALFSYETEVQPEISNRVYMVAGNIPRKAFKDLRTLDELPITYKQQLDTALDLLGPYLHICDMKKNMMKGIGNGGPAELRARLIEYKEAGQHIGVVVIDQLLSMAGPYMLATGLDPEKKRGVLIALIEQLRDICQELKCCMFILHQTDNVAKRKSPTTKPTGGQAAEDKSFENNMHFAMQFGTQDAAGIAWLAAVKHRYSAPEAIIVKQDPDYWKIIFEDGRFSVGPDGFSDRNANAQSYATTSAAAADKDKPQFLEYD